MESNRAETTIWTLPYTQAVVDEFKTALYKIIETAIEKGLPQVILTTILREQANRKLTKVRGQ